VHIQLYNGPCAPTSFVDNCTHKQVVLFSRANTFSCRGIAIAQLGEAKGCWGYTQGADMCFVCVCVCVRVFVAAKVDCRKVRSPRFCKLIVHAGLFLPTVFIRNNASVLLDLVLLPCTYTHAAGEIIHKVNLGCIHAHAGNSGLLVVLTVGCTPQGSLRPTQNAANKRKAGKR
jgi:hypothetical protein